MTTDILEIKAAMQIFKPIHEVFKAIVNPEKMCNCFISHSNRKTGGRQKRNMEIPLDSECLVSVVKIEKVKLLY